MGWLDMKRLVSSAPGCMAAVRSKCSALTMLLPPDSREVGGRGSGGGGGGGGGGVADVEEEKRKEGQKEEDEGGVGGKPCGPLPELDGVT